MTSKERSAKNLRKEILNSAFGEILRMLKYKCKWNNKELISVSLIMQAVRYVVTVEIKIVV